MPTGAELFIDACQRLQIDRIFTLVGDHLNEVLSVAAARGLKIIDFRHESGVTHAADCWARLTRKPALSLVTGGPGHTNALTGIATAQLSGSPLIAVSGAPAINMRGRVVFQDIDQVGMARPVCKWAAEAASVAQIPFLLSRAYSESSNGRKGATHLTIPVDLFTGSAATGLNVVLPREAGPVAPDRGDVKRAIRLLRSAKKPVVIAGSGVWWSDAGTELYAFLQRTKLPYFSVTLARGIISDLYKYNMGYADGALNKAVHSAFPEADVVLVLGKRIDYRLAMGGERLFSPSAKFIQVDIHEQELGNNRNLELGICGDVKATLKAMLEELDRESWKPLPWVMRTRLLHQQWQEELKALASANAGNKPMHPASFFAELLRTMPVTPLYAWDGGDFIHWGRAMFPATEAGGWMRIGPLGTIGSALPNAIAMQLHKPDRPVVMITGDGSLGFYIAELDTAVRHNLPVIVIVGNDGGWGLERELQGELNGTNVACELRRTRYDVVMKGFGGAGETINRVDQVESAVKRAFASNKPYLLNVNIKGARSPFTDWQIKGKK